MANYEYKDAGVDAPEGVQEAIEEFDKLPLEEKRRLPLLYYLLEDGTPPYKMSPQDADYARQPVKGECCANCVSAYQHVTSGDFICDQIRGSIEPQAWCRLWNTD